MTPFEQNYDELNRRIMEYLKKSGTKIETIGLCPKCARTVKRESVYLFPDFVCLCGAILDEDDLLFVETAIK